MINREHIIDYLTSRGLDFFGIAALNVDEDFLRFRSWLERGKHAEMAYLERYQEVRQEPRHLLPKARSVIVFGLTYANDLENDLKGGANEPKVAKYARLLDYHKILRREGSQLLEHLAGLQQQKLEGRVIVDTAPLLERAVAAKTDNIFIGKNTLAICPAKGSYFLLAELFIDLDLNVDAGMPTEPTRRDKTAGGCGTCRRCQVHCPTGALDTAYELDANRCLSYWTIENRGPIPVEFWPYLSKYWYGCDICQDVCPYNRAKPSSNQKKQIKRWQPKSLYHIATMTQAEYEAWFGGFPMTRAKREGLMRNALIAMWAVKHPRLEEAKTVAKNSNAAVLEETVKQMENL